MTLTLSPVSALATTEGDDDYTSTGVAEEYVADAEPEGGATWANVTAIGAAVDGSAPAIVVTPPYGPDGGETCTVVESTVDYEDALCSSMEAMEETPSEGSSIGRSDDFAQLPLAEADNIGEFGFAWPPTHGGPTVPPGSAETPAPPTAVPSAATPVSPPSWCASNTTMKVTRTQACINRGWFTRLVRTERGVRTVLGTASGNMQTYVYVSTKLMGVVNQTTIVMTSRTGDIGTQSVQGTFWCTGKCDQPSGTLPSRSLALNTKIYAIGGVKPNLQPGTRATSTTNWSFDFRTTKVPGTVRFTAFSAKARCDNAYPGGSGQGCVVPDYIPRVAYSASGAYPAFVSHLTKARTSGLRGFSATSPLTRTTSSTVNTANRNKACPSTITRPSGYSCDEYPFASTN